MIGPHSLVRQVQQSADAVLASIIPSGAVVALVGFQDHWNAGDSAIWLGTLEHLARRRCRIAYECSRVDYSRDTMARAIGDGMILIAGGGNLGDLWPNHQVFRERIIEDFPHNPIVQLPQSVCFEQRESLDRFRRVAAGHRNLHLLLRDHRSLTRSRSLLDAPSTLCPDMAFGLGCLARPAAAQIDILYLLRSDKESRLHPDADLAVADPRRDWLELLPDEEADRQQAAAISSRIRLMSQEGAAKQAAGGSRQDPRHEAFSDLARVRLMRGMRILSEGRVVVTDRLHAHVLSLLMGIPQVVLDNSDGKISAFIETWTGESAITRQAARAQDAAVMAGSLLAGGGP